MYEADIQAAIDRQLEIERKARAWDELAAKLRGMVLDDPEHWPAIVLEMMGHQPPSTRCHWCSSRVRDAEFCDDVCRQAHVDATERLSASCTKP